MPTVPPPPESSPDTELPPAETSRLLRFGALVGAGALAAGLAAAPAALRVAGELDGTRGRGGTWLAVTAALVAPMVLSVALMRAARVGLRAFEGAGSGRRLTAVLVWTTLFAAWLMVFGATLRATTHHHALAGATFAVVSVGVAAALAIVATRLGALVFARPPATRSALLALVALTLGVVCAIVAARLHLRGGASGDPQAAELVVDGLAFGIAALFASRPSLARRRAVALVGPPVAAIVLFLGFAELRGLPPLATALESRAPAYAPLFRLFAEH